jgi:hypothetical protein
MEKYASRLLEYKERTGLDFTEKTLATPLRMLMRSWSNRFENCDRKKKYEMPIWARRDGFPVDLPLIRGCPTSQIGEALYEVLSSPIFDDDWYTRTVAVATVDFNRRERKW